MTDHEAKARAIVERVYRDSGYHPQMDAFIAVVAAALAEVANERDTEIAQLRAKLAEALKAKQ